jgi:O-antigen/teichoic acid export membrane protein
LVAYGAGFAVTKLIAVTGGPAGVGLQSLIMSTAALIALLASLGIPQALPMLAAQASGSASDFLMAARRAYILGLPIPMVLGLWLVAQSVRDDSRAAMLGTALLAVASLWTITHATVLSVFSNARKSARFSGLQAGLSALVTLILVVVGGPAGVPIALGAGAALGYVATIGLTTVDRRGWQVTSQLKLKSVIRRSLSTYVSYSTSALAAGLLPIIFVSLAGETVGGLYRAASTLGFLPVLVLSASVARHFYPKAADIIRVRPDGLAEVHAESLRRLLTVATVASILLAAGLPVALIVAYSREFVEVAAPTGLILAAGLFRLTSWHYTYALQAAGFDRRYLLVEMVTAASSILLTVPAAAAGSISLAGFALLLVYVIQTVIGALVCHRAGLRVAQFRQFAWLLMGSALAIPALATVSWLSYGFLVR